MQHGDLATWYRPQMVVVLEGVLCDVTSVIERRGRIRKHDVIVGYDISWHELPLKRVIYLSNRWQDADVVIVTFTSEQVAERATDYLDKANVPYRSLEYRPYEEWTSLLRYRPEVMLIYDSSEERVQRYGQKGTIVRRGEDF